MYQNKLAVAIKHNGKVLRENKDLVHLPFGSEFTVLVKNLNSRRVKFTLHIDGQDVLDGTEIIVNANSETELKRYIRNGNMNEGNAFKFIERTQAIEDGPRGIKVEDGVVRVEYWFEQEVPTTVTTYHKDIYWDEYHYPFRRTIWNSPLSGPFYGSVAGSTDSFGDVSKSASSRGMLGGGTFSSASASGANVQSTNAVFGETYQDKSAPTPEVTINDAGITVPGSKVEQKFQAVYGFRPEAQSHVIILRLVGRAGLVNIAAPVTVNTKNICSTCSHVNKANAKFCNQCGTALELV
jgi:hypothetical protein